MNDKNAGAEQSTPEETAPAPAPEKVVPMEKPLAEVPRPRPAEPHPELLAKRRALVQNYTFCNSLAQRERAHAATVRQLGAQIEDTAALREEYLATVLRLELPWLIGHPGADHLLRLVSEPSSPPGNKGA